MTDHVDHLVPGRTEQDLFVEILLKRGLDLCSPVEALQIADKTVYSVDGIPFACLAEEIKRAHRRVGARDREVARRAGSRDRHHGRVPR